MNEYRCATSLLVALSATLTLGWLLDRGPGYGDAQEASELARLRRESAELDRALSFRMHRLQATNNTVVADVIAGRLSLLEAAARLRAADLEAPERMRPKLAYLFPGGNDDE